MDRLDGLDISIPRDVCQLHFPALNRNLVHTQDWKALRIYAIASAEFSGRGGWFTITALMDALQARYGYTTLHHGPGNNRTRERRRLAQILGSSPLFRTYGNAFRIVSWRKLSSTRSPRVELTGASLASSQAFNDYCLMVLIQGRHVPIESVCAESGLSRGQIYKSINRLIAGGHLQKYNKFALSEGMGLHQARAARAALKAAGIDTEIIEGRSRPAAFSPWGLQASSARFHIGYYLPNFYAIKGLAQGSQAITRTPFKRVEDRYTRLNDHDFKLTPFQAVYTFSALYDEAAYIQDHARAWAAA